MHRPDPFMLDEDIAELDEAPKKGPPPVAPPRQPEPEPQAAVASPRQPEPEPQAAVAPPPVVKPKEAPKAKRGRPKSANPKRQITLRLDAEIIDHFKAQGRGWQTRINDALRDVAGVNRSAK